MSSIEDDKVKAASRPNFIVFIVMLAIGVPCLTFGTIQAVNTIHTAEKEKQANEQEYKDLVSSVIDAGRKW